LSQLIGIVRLGGKLLELRFMKKATGVFPHETQVSRLL